MNCVIIESNHIQEQLIKSYINEAGSLNLLGSFNNCQIAFDKVKIKEIDILFLDLEIQSENGLETLNKYNLDFGTQIILMSSNSDAAICGFEAGVTDYLLKPISLERFSSAINKVVDRKAVNGFKKNFMFIKSKGLFVKLLFQDIVWIKSSYEYVVIHTLNKRYMVYSSMNKILDRLPNSFVRVHRSNIVSLDRIDKIDGNVLEVGGKMVKVSKMYKNELMHKLGIL